MKSICLKGYKISPIVTVRWDGLGFGRAINLSHKGVFSTGVITRLAALITAVAQLRLNSNLQVTYLL